MEYCNTVDITRNEIKYSKTYISLLSPYSSLQLLLNTTLLQNNTSSYFIFRFDDDIFRNISYYYSNIFTFHFLYENDTSEGYLASKFIFNENEAINEFYSIYCAYEYLV